MTGQSRAEKTAPVGQSAVQPAIESVDQTGNVREAKRHIPTDVVVIDKNAQAKCSCAEKSSPNASGKQEHQSSADDENKPNELLLPNSCWEPSEELDALLKVMLKPLQRFERRVIINEFPRPASDAAFTPNLDN